MLLDRDTKRGERKRRGKEKTPTQTHLARSMKRGNAKKKEGGRTEAPEPTNHSET